MSLEENKALVRKVIEAFNKRNLDLLDKLIAPDYVDHYHQLRSLEEYKQFLSMLLRAFPDWHENIEDIIAEEDKVWYRFKATATHTGEYRGYLPSTGRKITLAATGNKIKPKGVIICRIVDGKIVEAWEVSSLIDIYEPLGVIEYKEFPSDFP
jgi:C-1 hydroxylase